jgi:tetratricopeptide (TPR) repeat protein
MINIQTILEIPDWIQQGLKSVEYIRFGGIIREAKTKQIVAMLREVTPDISRSLDLLTPVSSVASILNLGVSILNLGVSVISFTLILKNLKDIEQQIKTQFSQVQDNINNLHRKFDISVYANFSTALDLAHDATTMIDAENRRNMATFAINRLLEAQHTFNDYINDSFEKNINYTDKFILSLSLAYLARSRCYLELEEFNSATSCLNEGAKVLRCYVEKYVKNLLISQPIARKIPSFLGGPITNLDSPVELCRLANICKWLEPALNNVIDDKSILFEAQTKNLVKFIHNKTNTDKFDVEGLLMEVAPIAALSAIPIFGGLIAPKIAEKVVHKHLTQHNCHDCAKEEINTDNLLEVIENIEQIIETYNRFEAYLIELQVMKQVGMSFHNWLQLTPHTEAQQYKDERIYIIPFQALGLK